MENTDKSTIHFKNATEIAKKLDITYKTLVNRAKAANIDMTTVKSGMLTQDQYEALGTRIKTAKSSTVVADLSQQVTALEAQLAATTKELDKVNAKSKEQTKEINQLHKDLQAKTDLITDMTAIVNDLKSLIAAPKPKATKSRSRSTKSKTTKKDSQ